MERTYAIEVVADATWWVYRLWARIALSMNRLLPRPKTRLGFAAVRTGDDRKTISLRFPFNAPGYLIETVAIDREIAFDVVCWPVATYFRSRGAADLCLASWCNLDYALAELAHEKLVRTKTLVGGSDRCDFRLKRDESGSVD